MNCLINEKKCLHQFLKFWIAAAYRLCNIFSTKSHSGFRWPATLQGTVVGGLLAWCPWGGINWRSLPWASGVPDRCGIFVGRYRPQIPRALGCQRGLALADLGCTVDHLDPTPANLIPPSSFAVSCDLKALWPDVLGCWGMGGRCTTWPINPPEVYTSFGPDSPGRQGAGCPCQSIGWRL